MENKNYTLKILAGIALICLSVASISFAVSQIKPLKINNFRTITISGESEVKAVPDSATIIATVKNQSALVSEAQKIIDDKTNQAIVELEKLGIEKKDIRSTSYRTGPRYENEYWGREDKIIGYEAVQTLEIRIQEIELADDVITTLGNLEINEVSGPNFKIEDNKEFKSKARIAAIENSRNEAEIVARALGAKLGKVVKFNEDNQFVIRHPMMAFAKAADSSESRENKLLPGEEIVKSKVTIVYSIE